MTRPLRTTLILTLLLLATQLYAESDDGGLLDFSIDGSNATITGFTAGASTTILTIPATVTFGGSTYNVTGIGYEAFIGNQLGNQLNSVTIPSSVTIIDDYAFYGNNQLASVTISDSVKLLECRLLEVTN